MGDRYVFALSGDKIALENFSPLDGLLGGVLIGAGAVMFMALNGRIAGISGILGGLLDAGGIEFSWRISFLAGLLAAPLFYGLIIGGLPKITIEGGMMTMVLGGLFVGFGTRLGSGCTSGHGVCGMARLSPRSIAATLVFMLCGFATVFLMRHVWGL